MKSSVIFIVILFFASRYFHTAESFARCDPDKLAVYKLTFETYWDRKTFPRQYPEWRPPAQWSKLVGEYFYLLFQLSAHKSNNR